MAEEFEGDLAGSVFWGADLRGATFRDVDLTGVSISHAWLVDVNIDALVDRMVINGVDVTDFVNERDPWYPLRAMLRAADPIAMRGTWAALEAEWATTIDPRPRSPTRRSTSRSTASGRSCRPCATSCSRSTSGSPCRYSANRSIRSGSPTAARWTSRGPTWIRALQPSVAEALAARADRAERVADFLATVDGGRPRSLRRHPRERSASAPRMHLHRLRGTVLAQPLRATRSRSAARLGLTLRARQPASRSASWCRVVGRRGVGSTRFGWFVVPSRWRDLTCPLSSGSSR